MLVYAHAIGALNVQARGRVATPDHPLVLTWTTIDATATAGATALDHDRL
jgi:hypothetical protein